MEALTLNKAIEHLTEMLIKDEFSCEECRNEHDQLRDWLIQLKEYKEKEEQGFLLRLPCKVGDTVYQVCEECGDVFALHECNSAEDWTCRGCEYCLISIRKLFFENLFDVVKYIDDFDKSVFLTREEAEKALQEKEEE